MRFVSGRRTDLDSVSYSGRVSSRAGMAVGPS